ncbi:MAG TPA: hypothetical protein VKT28_20945 [Puia sp.]|nr:hypothetical protein [Puia sp.]
MATKRGFPTALTVVMIVIVIAAIATWIIPPGGYNRLSFEKDHFVLSTQEKNIELPAEQKILDSLGIKINLQKFQHGDIRKPVAVPGSFHSESKNGQGLISILEAPFKGIYDSVDIIFFVLMVGGFVSIFYDSGALQKGIAFVASKMKGKEKNLIIVFTSLFALGGTTFGMAEETMAFYPLVVPVFLAAGFDLLVPVAVIYFGSNIGTMTGVTCPFSVILASDVAGINWSIGSTGRIIMFVITTAITIIFILRYADKIKKDPSKSLVLKYDGNVQSPFVVIDSSEQTKMSTKDKMILLLFASTFGMLIFGVVKLDWWLLEMTSLFFASSLLLAIFMRMKEKVFVEKLIKGAEGLLSVAFIVGFARGVTIILNDGHISDSILFYSSNLVKGMTAAIFIVSLLVLYLVLTIFISSTSGMAVLTMPIIAPLGLLVGMGVENIVTVYVLGTGIMNAISPTGLTLPSISMVNVSYKTWLKFTTPLLIILTIISAIFLVISVTFFK